MADEFSSISNETLKNIESLRSSMKDISSSTAKTSKALKDQDSFLASFESNFSKINSSAGKFAEIQDKAKRSAQGTIEAFKEQQKQLSVIRSLNAQIDNLYGAMLNASEKEAKLLKRQVENLSDARDNAKELVNEFGKLTEDSAKLDKSTQWFSSISEIVKDIPGLRKLSSPFEAAAQASRETVLNNAKIKSINDNISSLGKDALKTGKGLTQEKLKELGLSEITQGKTAKQAGKLLRQYQEQNKIQNAGIAGLQAGFKSLGPIIQGALGPLALIGVVVEAIKFFVDAMFAADQQITDIAKNLNISKESASEVRDRFFDISKSATALTNVQEGNLILQEDLVKTQLQFNTLLGTSVDLSTAQNEELVTQLTNANKFLKLNDEEFTGLIGLYAQTGKTVDQIKSSILGTTKAYKLQTGYQLDERKILGDVLKTSNSIKLSIKGGTEALVQATINAQKFGVSLDQLDKTADSLLNFEQSISNELEAELLIGRDLNLERARAAALTNDQVALTEEVGKLVASFGPDFQKNRIAQEAFANTLGISKNELADMYTTYQQNEKLRNAQLKLDEKEIENIEKKVSLTTTQKELLKAGKLSGVEFYDMLKKAGYEGEKLTDTLAGLSLQSLESQSAQEKFDDALKSAKETFTRFVDGDSLNKFADLLTRFVESVSIKGFWGTMFGGLANEGDILKAGKERLENQLKEAKTDDERIKIQEKLKESENKLAKYYSSEGYENELRSTSTGRAVLSAKKGEVNREITIGAKMATGGIVTGPTNALVGEAGPEAVIPLNKFYAKLDQLISAVEKGGNIYLDGTKVGTAMATNGFRVQ